MKLRLPENNILHSHLLSENTFVTEQSPVKNNQNNNIDNYINLSNSTNYWTHELNYLN